jgi:hypothetical protein
VDLRWLHGAGLPADDRDRCNLVTEHRCCCYHQHLGRPWLRIDADARPGLANGIKEEGGGTERKETTERGYQKNKGVRDPRTGGTSNKTISATTQIKRRDCHGSRLMGRRKSRIEKVSMVFQGQLAGCGHSRNVDKAARALIEACELLTQ